MESRQLVSVSKGRLAGNIVLALVIGALLPLVAVLQISLLPPVLMLGGIFAVRMQARAGWLPAAVLFGAALASTMWFLGEVMALMLLAAAILPAVWVMRGMARKRPFFEQMKWGVVAYALGLVVAMVTAYLSFGGRMIARFTDVLRAEFVRMPDAALQPFVEAINSALSLGGATGQRYTVALYREQLDGVLDLMQQTYAQALPGALLTGALLSGVISVFWGNWTMARQGRATNESFVGMTGWFLPAQLTWGLLGLWVAGLVLAMGGYSAGPTAYDATRSLACAGFFIQAMAALDRRMLRSGRELGRRKLLIGLLCAAGLLLPDAAVLLAVMGVASALFGSHGALKRPANRDQSDRDDPQE